MINVLYFGMIAETTQIPTESINDIATLTELEEFLLKKYPLLEKLQYKFAVNGSLINQMDIPLQKEDTIALLPPFAGG